MLLIISFSSAVIVCLFVCVLFKYSINVFSGSKLLSKTIKVYLQLYLLFCGKLDAFAKSLQPGGYAFWKHNKPGLE